MLPQCLFLWSEAITIKQFAKLSTVIQTFVFSSIFSTFNIAENEMKSSYSGITKVIIKVLIGISVFFMVKEEELESGSSADIGRGRSELSFWFPPSLCGQNFPGPAWDRKKYMTESYRVSDF